MIVPTLWLFSPLNSSPAKILSYLIHYHGLTLLLVFTNNCAPCKFIHCLSTSTLCLDGLRPFVNPSYNSPSYSLGLSALQSCVLVSHHSWASPLGCLDFVIDFMERSEWITLFLYASNFLICKLKKLLKVIMIIIIWSTFIECLLCVKQCSKYFLLINWFNSHNNLLR